MIRLKIQEVIEFYDNDRAANVHANSIKTISGEEMGMALLKHYFDSIGENAEIMKFCCTTGHRKGPRLDGWIRIGELGKISVYQVEVKSWSVHGFGASKKDSEWHASDATDLALEDYRKRTWRKYWDSEKGRFRGDLLNKVLTKMKYREDISGYEHRALACLWQAIHPAGKNFPFFCLPCKEGDFTEVFVFSMSNYLRNLSHAGVKEIELDMPLLATRLKYLERMISLNTGDLKLSSKG